MQFALGTALEDPSRSSPKFAAAAVEWAQSKTATPRNEDDEDRTRKEAVVTAAMIAMRDGDAELQARHAEWARSVFAQALQTKEDPVHRFRSGLRFNPIAIAFAGMIHLLKDHAAAGDVRSPPRSGCPRQPSRGPRIRRYGHHSCLYRRTFAARGAALRLHSVYSADAANGTSPRTRSAARSEHHRQRVQAAVDAELAWLADERPEPNWPAFPAVAVRRRQLIRIPPAAREERDTPAPQRATIGRIC